MTKIYKYACMLNNIPRFTGKNLTEYVGGAEHSYRVSILSMLFVDEYNLLNPNSPINVEEVLRKALIHDLEEVITGDIPTPLKKFKNFREIYRDLAQNLMKNEILQGLPEKIKSLYYKMWVEDKDNESGEVIKLADRVEALMCAYFELKRRNHNLEDAYINYTTWFNTEEARALMDKFPSSKEYVRKALSLKEEHFYKHKPVKMEL